MFTGGVVMNKNELLKVMIVDDEEMIRRGLRAIVTGRNTATPFAVTPQMEKTAIKRRWFISRI